MQGLRCCSNDVVLTPSFSIDAAESAESRIHRLISEHPVIIFSRSSCCMCHVMKKLLANIGVHPTVIELDDHEISALPPPTLAPSAFIGGACVGGLESLVALHLSGHLVPKLVEVGALWVWQHGNSHTLIFSVTWNHFGVSSVLFPEIGRIHAK